MSLSLKLGRLTAMHLSGIDDARVSSEAGLHGPHGPLSCLSRLRSIS